MTLQRPSRAQGESFFDAGTARPAAVRVVRLGSETDFDGWREAARALRAEGVAPQDVIWTVDGEGGPPGPVDHAPDGQARAVGPAFRVPRAFLDLAGQAVLHRSPERFALLYRLLWRLGGEPALLRDAGDPDVARAGAFARDVERATHKMKAFVRFRRLEGVAPETFAAWFEPAHRVAERAAPFFARRFAGRRFSLLTPDVCLHWDGEDVRRTSGADPADAPAQDSLEAYWRTHYGRVFDPAREVVATNREDGEGHGGNPPEPGLIPDLVASMGGRTAQMASKPPDEPARRIVRAARRHARDAPFDGPAPTSLAELAASVQVCRRCELWRDATQAVPGEGPATARLMLVGEQPGDQEDRTGRPFVGPAGEMLDRALTAAEVPREATYVTNAVKHFKHELRGKRRLHKRPDAGEVGACRWWLEAERRLVRPRVVAALGATAALAVFGRPTPIGESRGRALQLPDQSQGVVTYHPSYLLRVPDAAARTEAFEMFVQDLRLAWKLAG